MSDIHADESREAGDTRIFVESPGSPRGQSPMMDLERLVAAEAITADYLLLPGDTANKANAQGLQFGWRRSHDIAQALGSRLLATPGNHDVVTRFPTPDGSSMLKNLLPTFPTGDLGTDDSFWKRGWAVIEKADHRILILNSTADFPEYPSSATEGSVELESYLQLVDCGGLAANVEDEIQDYLEGASPKLNIAVLHHHPLEHQLRVHLQDSYGPMRRGGELVDLLTRTHTAGRWLVVHGHKHIPQLVNATGASANGPIMLCSGSLGAKLWDPVTTVARNQFHVVDVQLDLQDPVMGLSGAVTSYTWGVGVGWYLSERTGSGLPGFAGFGNSIESRLLAVRVNAAVPTTPGMFTSFAEVVAVVPELPFVLPVDWESLEDQASSLGVRFVRDRRGRIVSAAREVANV